MSIKTDPTEINTEGTDIRFIATISRIVQFDVRVANDARICLASSEVEADPMYEVIIGVNGNMTAIRKNHKEPNVSEVSTPDILSKDEFRSFWINFSDNMVRVGRKGEAKELLSFKDNEPIPIKYIGFGTEKGESAAWRVHEGLRSNCGCVPIRTGWVKIVNGKLPPSPVKGGEQSSRPVLVARAHWKGGLIPGKVVPPDIHCYIAMDGKEHTTDDYEMLDDVKCKWVKCTGKNIPKDAIVGGYAADGETLYIASVVTKQRDGIDVWSVGRVVPSRGVCLVGQGEEYSFTDYEILVSA